MKGLFALFLSLVIPHLAWSQTLFATRVSPFEIGSEKLNGIAGATRLVAVGDTKILYSINGDEWHVAEGGRLDQPMRAVAFGDSKFVAVGASAFPYISTNAINWTTVYLPQYPNLGFTDVCFANGMFFISGTNFLTVSNIVYASTNSLNWIPISVKRIRAVAYNFDTFSAIGDVGQILQSTDGMEWSVAPVQLFCASTNCPIIERFIGLIAHDNLFKATAMVRDPLTGTQTRKLLTSFNGRDWGIREIGLPDSVATESPDLFILENHYVVVSAQTNGTSQVSEFWGSDLLGREAIIFAGDLRGVAGLASHWTTVSHFEGRIFRDGYLTGLQEVRTDHKRLNSYLSRSVPRTDVAVGSFARLPDGSSSEAVIYCSTNSYEAAFGRVEAPQGAGGLSVVKGGQGQFIAVGANGTVIRSSDGINWSKRLSNTSADMFDIVYGGNLWVAVGQNGRIITSTNGAIFSLQSSGTDIRLNAIAFGAGQFVAVGQDGAILRSSDGTNWTGFGTAEALDLYAIAYVKTNFVAVGTNGIVHVSADGLFWQSSRIEQAGLLSSVCEIGKYIVLAEYSTNRVYISDDRQNWRSFSFGDERMFSVVSGGNYIYGTGENSAIWRGAWGAEPTISLSISTDTFHFIDYLHVHTGNPGVGILSDYDLFISTGLTQSSWGRVVLRDMPTDFTIAHTNRARPSPNGPINTLFYKVRKYEANATVVTR